MAPNRSAGLSIWASNTLCSLCHGLSSMADCSEDESCRTSFPTLREDLAGLLDLLEAGPARVRTYHPVSGPRLGRIPDPRGEEAPSHLGLNYPRIPAASPLRTARVRSRTPSLRRTLDTRFLTVPSESPTLEAISRLL